MPHRRRLSAFDNTLGAGPDDASQSTFFTASPPVVKLGMLIHHRRLTTVRSRREHMEPGLRPDAQRPRP